MSLHNPGILLDRRTTCYSQPDEIRAEMEELRESLKDYPEFLEEVLQEMEEDIAHSIALNERIKAQAKPTA